MKFRNPKIGDFIKLPSREIGLLRRFADDGEFGVVRCYSQEFDNTWVASYTREYLKRNRIKPQDVPNDIWEHFALPTPASDFRGKDRTLDNQLAAAEHSLNKYRLMGKKCRENYAGDNSCSLCQISKTGDYLTALDCDNCPITLSGQKACISSGSAYMEARYSGKTKPIIKCLEKTVTWLKQENVGQEESKKADADIRYHAGGSGYIFHRYTETGDFAKQGRSSKSREEAEDFAKLEALTTRFKARIAELNGDEYTGFLSGKRNYFLDLFSNCPEDPEDFKISDLVFYQSVPDSYLFKSTKIGEQLIEEFSPNEIVSVIKQKWCES